MTNPLLLLRSWPQLARTWQQRSACVRSFHQHASQQPFVPMAILLDKAQAYKPAPSNEPSASQ